MLCLLFVRLILLGCEDCQKAYSDECPKHKLQSLADKVVLSRAWASLPPNLQIFRLVQPANETVSGMVLENHSVNYMIDTHIKVLFVVYLCR
jgi:hypothetical protein